MNEATDDGVLGCSGISWTICNLHLAPDTQPHQHLITQKIFTGRMLFLTPDQQRQSTEGTNNTSIQLVYTMRVSEINKRKKTTNKQDKKPRNSGQRGFDFYTLTAANFGLLLSALLNKSVKLI